MLKILLEDLLTDIWRLKRSLTNNIKRIEKKVSELDGAIDLGAESISIIEFEKILANIDNQNPIIKEYILLSGKMRTAIRNRLIEKHEKHKDLWKTADLDYLRERIVYLYELWSYECEKEPIRLLDLANQCLLLFIRLENEKNER